MVVDLGPARLPQTGERVWQADESGGQFPRSKESRVLSGMQPLRRSKAFESQASGRVSGGVVGDPFGVQLSLSWASSDG